MAARAADQQIVRLPKKLRLAIIGLEGHIGEILGPLDRLPDVELVAIQDRDPALMREVAGSNGEAAVDGLPRQIGQRKLCVLATPKVAHLPLDR